MLCEKLSKLAHFLFSGSLLSWLLSYEYCKGSFRAVSGDLDDQLRKDVM